MTDNENNDRSAEDAKETVAQLGAVLDSAALQSAVAAQDRMLEMRAELASVRETVRAQLGEDLEEARVRIAGLQAEIADLKAALAQDRLTRELKQATEAGRKLEAELAAARVAVRQSQEKTAKAERAVTAMRASTSWRLTGPLRGLSRLLRGRR